MEIVLEKSFHICPRMLYRIKIRGICRQQQQSHLPPCLLYKFKQRLFAVKRRVIHNYRTPSRNLFEQAVGKPVIKKHSIACMFILFNGDMFAVAKTTYDIHTLAVLPACGVVNLLTAFGIAVFPLHVLVYAAFVNIEPFLFWYFSQFA